MVTLNLEQLRLLELVRPVIRRSANPAAIARKARRTAGFNNSILAGFRYSKHRPNYQ